MKTLSTTNASSEAEANGTNGVNGVSGESSIHAELGDELEEFDETRSEEERRGTIDELVDFGPTDDETDLARFRSHA